MSRLVGAVSMLLVALLLAVGCGDDDDADAGNSSNEAAAAQDKPLEGKTIWYADVVPGNVILDAYVQGVNNVLAPEGAKVVRSFGTNQSGQLDVSVMAQALDRATTEKPAAILYWVLDPKNLKPQVERAMQADIPVFALFAKPDGFEANGWIDLDHEGMGRVVGEAMAEELPKGSEVSIISPALPIPAGELNVDGVVEALKAHGIKIVGDRNEQRNLTDNADGGRQVMQGILQRFPDVDGVYAYNDDSAIGAIAAAKAAGKRGKIVIASRNGTDLAIDAIKAGDLSATCDLDPIKVGQVVGKAVLAHLTGEKTYEGNEQIPPPDSSGCLVTEDNVDSYVPWKERIEYQKIEEK